MELNHEPVTTPTRAAATVVMLRDGAQGMEVFLLKRHAASDVLGGAYVFPGGKVDAGDAQINPQVHLDLPPAQLPASLNEPDIDEPTACGLYIAAMREAFEESGVLFAKGAGSDDALAAGAMLRQGQAFADLLALMNLQLQASRLLPWSRWITPFVPSLTNKRFDTRFFVAEVPHGQEAVHSDHESSESVWVGPRDALLQYRDGLIQLAPPQIMSLYHLSRHTRVADVLAAAANRLPPVIQPEPFELDGQRTICYPGDARHPVATVALPGPSRLVYRHKRFEPPEGFDRLLD